MSDCGTETKQVVIGYLDESLKEMTDYLRFFSLGMRSLYSDKNPGTSTDVSRKFAKLRDDTREDAKIYLKVILPLTTKFVSSIKDFFEYYDALSYDEWCASLPDILENIKANKDLADTLLKMYEEIIVPLKKREDEAMIIFTEFKDLQIEYENATKKLLTEAQTKLEWVLALAFIPVVNVIATPFLESYAEGKLTKAIANIQESKIHEAAALVVAKTLIPALANFIKGLTHAAGFFQTMEIELNSFEEKGKEAKVLHYKMMKNKVQKINPSCHKFYATLPAIRTDFEAIPSGNTQQNYVEKWLEEKLKEIEKRKKSTQKLFWDVVQGIQGISLRPIMVSSSLEPVEMSFSEQA